MERTAQGSFAKATAAVERTANDLALELIAPRKAVLAELENNGALSEWREILRTIFGLPDCWARPYAQQLMIWKQGRRSFSDRLGL